MTKEELFTELMNCRNELCLKCGAYRDSHLGACDGCRYNFENMAKWDTIEERPTGGRVVPDVLQGWRYDERPTGEWICTFHSTFPQYEPSEYRCSKCNGRGNESDKFCKHCGAKMEVNNNG